VALLAKNNKHLILASGTFSEETMAAIRSETFLKEDCKLFNRRCY
jgi:hypothetical protein